MPKVNLQSQQFNSNQSTITGCSSCDFLFIFLSSLIHIEPLFNVKFEISVQVHRNFWQSCMNLIIQYDPFFSTCLWNLLTNIGRKILNCVLPQNSGNIKSFSVEPAAYARFLPVLKAHSGGGRSAIHNHKQQRVVIIRGPPQSLCIIEVVYSTIKTLLLPSHCYKDRSRILWCTKIYSTWKYKKRVKDCFLMEHKNLVEIKLLHYILKKLALGG